jgi:hypothetical protein
LAGLTLSKKLTRLPGEDPPPDVERGRRLLALRPRRTVETWKVDPKTGRVVVTHPKAFGRVEASLARWMRGKKSINRQLDEYGSLIWLMCDGSHTVEEIARALEGQFHEAFEPALPRTLKFVSMLAERRLVVVDGGPVGGGAA